MRYCPKCGAKLTSNDKYCDRCGTFVGVKKQVQPASASTNAVNKTLNKNSRIRRNCLIIAACVMILAAGGVVFFTLQSENNANAIPFIGSNKKANFDDTVKSLGFKNKKISPSDMAGLTISFAHMSFPDDSDWKEAFDDAENGDLNVQSYPKYDFGDYEVEAPSGGAVYVVTPKVGYVVSDVEHPEQAKVTFVSSKGQGKQVDLPSLTQQVKDKTSSDEVQKVAQKVYVTKKSTIKESDSDSSSSSSSSEESSSDDISWDDDKESQLADFMDSFGKKMKQDYDEYDGHDSIKTLAGEKYPDDLENHDVKLYSDDSSKKQMIDIGWDPELEKDYDYHVVSIFNCNVGNPEDHITYLFCVHDDKPVALVDQTTNGDAIMVKETSNQDVRTAFANILENKDDDDD
ncbi:MAG: DUF4767 domain-containing protein [Lactobacillus sp.]